MNQRYSGRDNVIGRRLLLGSCLIGAAILLIAAFMEGDKQASTAGWVPLNEAMEEKLAELKAEKAGVAQEEAEAPQAEPNADDRESDQGDQAVSQTGRDQSVESELAAAKDKAEPSAGAGALLTSRDEAGRLDLNRATAAELDELKGIGPSKAQAIVDDREKNGLFASVDDLLRVKGIGEKLLAGIKDSVVTRP